MILSIKTVVCIKVEKNQNKNVRNFENFKLSSNILVKKLTWTTNVFLVDYSTENTAKLLFSKKEYSTIFLHNAY